MEAVKHHLAFTIIGTEKPDKSAATSGTWFPKNEAVRTGGCSFHGRFQDEQGDGRRSGDDNVVTHLGMKGDQTSLVPLGEMTIAPTTLEE